LSQQKLEFEGNFLSVQKMSRSLMRLKVFSVMYYFFPQSWIHLVEQIW